MTGPGRVSLGALVALIGGYADAPFPANSRLGAWLRLPLQVPLVL